MADMKLPKVADSSDTYVVVSVEVAVGDRVAPGDVVLVVETDKVDAEVAAGFSGEVTAVLVGEDDEVAVGATVLEYEP
ncbi:hypothetical protein H5392_03445 [Tessaracoccus sp. MC1865]|uniref:biotin/lipoyl-containing protein n=1 Tax=Tessaracoccus sp. MC1865 TaxID=2760310 RepID=UPI001601CC72|nr:biotin/lipoyl-containing protein [Tessaracoccus sp. MC1865]MBB1482913.1 hypothetical protein [Tessaracoccus sp. MC1865]QTO37648.1 hypothetical protein J7D54_00640 [Tessaracoccus sp. MC1865]